MEPLYDCYVRLDASALKGVSLVHLQSGVDAENDRAALASDAATALPAITGYTEWISQRKPTVSIGWDWRLIETGQPCMVPCSIRTNVMLVDEAGRDRGLEATILAMQQLVEQTGWQPEVLAAFQAPTDTR